MSDEEVQKEGFPLVSVIMPTYNDRPAIAEAIKSIVGQTLASWELIIVDDASTDGTAEFVKANFDDPRLSLIRMEKNSGSGFCRNRAIEAAQGQFIAVMDADDISMPDRLQIQADRMLAAPELAAVSAQVMEFGSWGGPVLGTWPTTGAEIAARQAAMKMPIPHPATMFRRDILVAAGGYDMACRRAQDYGLFLKLSDAKLETLEKPLVMYRTNRPISLGYVIRNEQYADLARVRSRLRAAGIAYDQLPTEPPASTAVYLRALKSWIIRNSREQWELVKHHLAGRRT